MSKSTLRTRAISIAAAAAIAGGALAVAPTITTTGDASAATCQSTSTVKKTLLVDYIFQKSVPTSVGLGTSVTYSLSVSTNSVGNPYVQDVWDTPPTQLKGVKPTVKVKSYTLLGGILGGGGAFGNLIKEVTVDPGDVHADGDRWQISHTGWSVVAGQAYTAEFTYLLPKSISAGAKLTSGGAAFQATPKPPLGYVNLSDLTACTTVRAPNAGEAALGSLDKNGLGSAEGQLSSTGSMADILPGLIGGIAGGK